MEKSNKKSAKKIAKTTGNTALDAVLFVLKIIGTILLICVTTGLIFACIFSLYIKTNLTSNLDVALEDFTLDQTSVLYYRDETGKDIELVPLQSLENRVWVDYENIPKDVEHAVVAIEDQRFYEHHGVDWYRTVAAFFNMFLSMDDTFGGSTLTQQLLKNLTEDDDVTVQRKLTEIFRALELEKTYTKEEILEWYLNVVYFGNGCYGIGAAADYYYGKDVSELSVAEIASIVGITNNPSLYCPYISMERNKDRQEIILSEMYRQGYLNQQEYEKAKNEPLILDQGDKDEESEEAISKVNYTYFEDAVIEDVIKDLMELKDCSYDVAERLLFTGGYKIITTIDPKVQKIVDSVYTDVENNLVTDGDTQLQSAIVITNPYTGDIVAMAGGMGQKDADRTFNRATQSHRPPGSSIKPLSVYSPAMEFGLITPETKFDDSEKVRLKGTDWMPENDSHTYSGVVTIRQAIVNSLNTVAAQVMDLLSPDVSYKFMTERLGVESLVYYREGEDGLGISDVDYAPLALGQLSDGITVREMASAYTMFPNNGVRVQGRTYSYIYDADNNLVYENVPESTTAISEAVAYWMTNILQEAATSGTGYEANLDNMPTAGKTGTTSDSCDRWFCGFTPYYTAACWVGYDTPEEIYWSGNPAAQMWYKVMSQIHENLEYREFNVPENTYLSPVPGVDMPVSASPSPTIKVSPTPKPSPTAEPTAEPTVEPTEPPEPTAEPTAAPTEPPEPTEEPQPEPPVTETP